MVDENTKVIASVKLGVPSILHRWMCNQNVEIDVLSADCQKEIVLATISASDHFVNKVLFEYFKTYPSLALPNIKNESKFIIDSLWMYLGYLDFEPELWFAPQQIQHLERRTVFRCVFRNNPRRS